MNLGDRAKDRINGWAGIVIARAEYLFGSPQVLLAHEKVGEKGERQKSEWLDEDRCEVIGVAVGTSTPPAPQGR